MRSRKEVLFVGQSDWARVRKKILAENISTKNFFTENIFGKNIFSENIFSENIFRINVFGNNITIIPYYNILTNNPYLFSAPHQ